MLSLKFCFQLKSSKTYINDYLCVLNLNKLETFLNSKPLTLLYLSKIFFTAEQILRDNNRRFKFIIYQITERDYMYDNLINVTRYSRNFANFEFFLSC